MAGTDARGEGRRVALTRLRRGTVYSMTMSAHVPQFTLQRDIATEGLRRVRRELKERVAAVTLTDVITAACARTLREHPNVNASFHDEAVVEHSRVNIGLAFAMDDGLTVPVVLDADQRSLPELAAERERLVERARRYALHPDEIFGGTFTISNLGPLGVDRFNALVLPPQAAILALGAMREKLALSVAFDHRAVDGAPGARFLATLARSLSEPDWALGLV